ncbi:MAG: response regulator [Alphaproteobacteria bacterium]|nr:MAG: response regulator [Alphaproteobacteria bacterium]
MVEEIITILIVDDEPDLLWMYQELFKTEGFKVLVALSVNEGMEIYKNNQDIRLIISDSTMEPLSGVQFLQYLKQSYQTIPMFYLATGDLEMSEQFIKSQGGHSLVLKPFDLDEIFIKIRKDLQL